MQALFCKTDGHLFLTQSHHTPKLHRGVLCAVSLKHFHWDSPKTFPAGTPMEYHIFCSEKQAEELCLTIEISDSWLSTCDSKHRFIGAGFCVKLEFSL